MDQPPTLDEDAYNKGLDQLLSVARELLQAQQSLQEALATARAGAQLGWEQGRAPAPPPPPNMGLETAPPDVRLQLETSFCGSTTYPHDLQVESLWEDMAREAADKASGAAATRESPLSLGAWSPWRLRALGSGALQAALLGIGFARDNVAAAYAAEALERWSALATCIGGGGLQRGMPAAAEVLERESSSGRRVEAYVTHLTDDDYVLGATVLAASLAASGTTRPLLALVTDGVSALGRKTLHDAGWALLDVELVGFKERDSQHIRGYFSKIWLWGLPCHSVIYLDTDTVVLRNLDHLFSGAGGSELAAVPDSQPHMSDEMVVQAGLMVVEPSPMRFADLWEVCCGGRRPQTLDEWKQHEQGFLTAYFDGDRGAEACGPGEPRPQWRLLPAEYNFTVRYHLRPLYAGLTPENTAVVHFACCKPWDPKQRHFAPPAYVQLFLEFARTLDLPWSPSYCAMDELRELEQQRKMEQIVAEQQMRG